MLTYLSEADVRAHLTLNDSIEALEDAFRSLAAGRGEVVARRRLALPGGLFHWMPSSLEGRAGVMGAKLYTTFGERRESLLMVFDAHTGRFLALIQSYHLSLVRTAAATAVATRYLARSDAHVAAIIGTGSTALLQLQGIAAVRPIDDVRVFSRRPEVRERFATTVAAELGVRVSAAASVEEAVRGSDVIVTATDAATPILHAEWIKPGAHVNAIGSNFATKREIGADVLLRAQRVVVDSLVSAHEEAGDIVLAVEEGQFTWDRVDELGSVVAGSRPGRQSAGDITVFKSVGVAIEDLAVAARMLSRLLAGRSSTGASPDR